MSEHKPASAAIDPDRIDPHTSASASEWARKFQVTESQVIDAVSEVGDLATDVELHFKGTRSTTNGDRTDEA
jgi:hypothetical protein